MATSEELQNAHDSGGHDRSESRPTDSSDLIIGMLSFGMMGNDGNYNPPSDPELKEAYDTGYDNAGK